MAAITRESFSQAMHAAVDERGRDYVYPEEWLGEDGCQYATDAGEPACLVGLALHKLGVNVARLTQSASAFQVLSDLGVDDLNLRNAAQEAQGEQDALRPWGEALDEFDVILQVAS